MRYFVTIGGREVEVDLTGPRPRVDGREVEADLARVPGTERVSLRLDGRSFTFDLARGARRGEWAVMAQGRRLAAAVVDERTRAIRQMAGAQEAHTERTIVAPMPGLVVRVEVEVGEAVRGGQGVVIVEAMKMENELKAPGDGVVARIEVQAGQTVEKGSVLLVLE
jgi:biotin carboxyl carrier protein